MAEELYDRDFPKLNTLGFERTSEPAYYRHAALQQDDGTWKSKLAGDEDIKHTLAGLEGPAYGRVIGFLRRPRK
jgi:hypothetical protein